MTSSALPDTMKAAVLHDGATELVLETVPRPEVADGECLIRIVACGVCGSDCHISVDGKEKLKAYPRILGHEASGLVVVSKGSRFKEGDRVIIAAGTACLECEACRRGDINLCDQVGVLGFERDGAYAEYISVDERFLFQVPDKMDMAEAAIVADAVSTPFHALVRKGELKAGQSVLLTGVGGLGLQAVKIAKAMQASKIIAVDIEPSSLERAKAFGADETILAKGNWARSIRKAGGVNLAVDFTGNEGVQGAMLRSLAKGGRLVLVGIGYGGLKIPYTYLMIAAQHSICGSFGCSQHDIPAILDLWKEGRLDLSDSVTSRHPLSEVNDCLWNLHNRADGVIRQVIMPGGLNNA